MTSKVRYNVEKYIKTLKSNKQETRHEVKKYGKYVMTSNICHKVKKYVLTSKVRKVHHDIKRKFVMTSKRHDDKKFVP